MTTKLKKEKMDNLKGLIIDSWWNRTLPWVDLDHGGRRYPRMSEGRWIKSVTKDVNKLIAQTQQEERRKVIEEMEKLAEYAEHQSDCILARYSAGRPTKSGGYEQKFAGKWYQARPIDKTPKCECGLDNVLSALNSKSGGK